MSDTDILTMLDSGELCKPDLCRNRKRGCACTDTAKRFRELLSSIGVRSVKQVYSLDGDLRTRLKALNDETINIALLLECRSEIERLTAENRVMLEYLETQGLSKADVELWVSMCGQSSAASTGDDDG